MKLHLTAIAIVVVAATTSNAFVVPSASITSASHSSSSSFLKMKMKMNATETSFATATENLLTPAPEPEDRSSPRSFWDTNAKSLFDSFDVDNSGNIDMQELKQVASELFQDSVWDKEDLIRLARDMDTNKDGVIDFNEFKQRWLSNQEQANTSKGARRRVITSDDVMQVEKYFLKAKESEGLSPMKEELSYDDIQTVIDVSRPYYALENEGAVKIGDETIGFVADVSQEMPFPHEDGKLGFSEITRHMAIAGSVAAALRNPKKSTHYYLALNGLMRRNEVPPSSICDGIEEIIPFAGKPRIFAYSTHFNKRESTSEIFLFTGETHGDGDVVRMNVSYKVIAATLYSRFFPKVKGIDKSLLGPWTPEKSNPYTEAIDIPISDEVFDRDSIVYNAKIPKVCPSKCYGHFDSSPCLPVAFLIGHFVEAGMQSVDLLRKKNGIANKPLLIAKHGFLDAANLVQAGTYGLHLKGMTKCIDMDKGVYKFTFDAFADEDGNNGEKIAYFAVTFAETECEDLAPSYD